MNPDIAVQAIVHHHRGGDEAEAGVPALSPPWTDPKKFTKNPVEKNGSIW